MNVSLRRGFGPRLSASTVLKPNVSPCLNISPESNQQLVSKDMLEIHVKKARPCSGVLVGCDFNSKLKIKLQSDPLLTSSVVAT